METQLVTLVVKISNKRWIADTLGRVLGSFYVAP